MRNILFSAFVVFLFAVNSVSADNYAVLVGVNDYTNPSKSYGRSYQFKTLDCCVNDMTELKAALIKCKFTNEQNIRLLTSDTPAKPTRSNILAALDEILKKIDKNDTIFFAFAGHGLSVEDNKQNLDLLCCCDAKISSTTDYSGVITRTELEKKLDCPAKIKLLMLDACRSGLAIGTLKGLGFRSFRGFSSDADVDVDVDVKGQQIFQNVPGLVRIASCGLNEVSHEDRKLELKNKTIKHTGHGIFTYHLIQCLNGDAPDPNKELYARHKLTISDVFSQAKKSTQEYAEKILESKQTPKIETPPGEHDEIAVAFVIGSGYDIPEPAPGTQPVSGSQQGFVTQQVSGTSPGSATLPVSVTQPGSGTTPVPVTQPGSGTSPISITPPPVNRPRNPQPVNRPSLGRSSLRS